MSRNYTMKSTMTQRIVDTKYVVKMYHGAWQLQVGQLFCNECVHICRMIHVLILSTVCTVLVMFTLLLRNR